MTKEMDRPISFVCGGLAISRLNSIDSLLKVEYDQVILHPDYPKCKWGWTTIYAELTTVEITDDYLLIKPHTAEPIYIKRDVLGWAGESRVKHFIESFHKQKTEKN